MELPRSSRRSTAVGDYLLGEAIGKGAHGQVYRAIDQRDGTVVAIKEIPLRGLDAAALRAITVETDLLSSLSHPNVVAYLGTVETKSYRYIVLELAENGSLAGIVKPTRFGPCPEPLAAVYAAQMLDGLAYLHAQGVVHRDVKGANVLTTKDGVVKLADFGVAVRASASANADPDDAGPRRSSLAGEHEVQGTPYWMAPEVIEMGGATAASDVWSVACTVLELVTGAPPYFDMQPMPAMFAIARDPRPPLPERASPALRDFLKRCFRKDPKTRPSAAEMREHEWIRRASEGGRRRGDGENERDVGNADANANAKTKRGSDGGGDALGADSDDEDWEPPAAMEKPRRRRPVPPSSPFQDAPSLDLESVRVAEKARGDKTDAREERRGEGSNPRGEGATRALDPEDLAGYRALTTALREATAPVGSDADGTETAETAEAFARAVADAIRAATCAPSCVDAAVERAGTVTVLVDALARWSASDATDADRIVAAAADAADVVLERTARIRDAAPGSIDDARAADPNERTDASARRRGSPLGAAASRFLAEGGVPATLAATGRNRSSSARLAALRLTRRLATLGGSAARTVLACGAPRFLAAALDDGYRGVGRETTRVALDAIFALDAYASSLARSEGAFAAADDDARFDDEDDSDDDAFARDERAGLADAACVAFARAGIPARLVAALGELNAAAAEETGSASAFASASASAANLPTKKSVADPAAESAAARATVSGAYRESVARLLTTMTRRRGAGGAAARAATRDVPVAHALLALAGSSLPRVTSRAVLRVVAALSRDASAAESMQRAGAVPKLVRFLQWEDPETRDVAFRALRNLCAGSRARAEQAAVAGAVPHLVAIAAPEAFAATMDGSESVGESGGASDGKSGASVGASDANGALASASASASSSASATGANGDGAHWLRGDGAVSATSLRPLAASFLCDMASASRKTRQKLAECGALDAYVRLLRGDAGRSAAADAAEALSAWVDDEPWLVEAKLMEPNAMEVLAVAMDPTRADAATLEALANTLARSPRARDALFAAGAFSRVAATLRASHLNPNPKEISPQIARGRGARVDRARAGVPARSPVVSRAAVRLLAAARGRGARGEEGADAAAAAEEVRAALRGFVEGGGLRVETWWGEEERAAAAEAREEAARALRAME